MSSHRKYLDLNETSKHRHRDTPSRSPTSLSQDAASSAYSPSQYSKSSENSSISSTDEELPSRLLEPGLYVPIIVPYHRSNEDPDLPTAQAHSLKLIDSGARGIVVQGSNGEAVHLSHHERKIVTKAVRSALDDSGHSSVPIIVGCGAESVRETVELCHEALASGGDYALVLPPSYYAPLFKPHTVTDFFQDVADASPIPILIYNYPKAVRGIDLDSDAIITLSKHPKIVGVKATDGNTGKMNRVASAINAAAPFKTGSGFMVMAGSADFIIPSLVVGGSGAICGLANLAPKACATIMELYVQGKMREAQKLQAIVARGDWMAIRSGVVGIKSALETYCGYGGVARKPLPAPTEEEAQMYAEGFKELMELERSL